MAIDVDKIKSKISENAVYTIKEINTATSIPIGTLRRWLKKGKLKGKKIGGKIYISGKNILDMFIDEGK